MSVAIIGGHDRMACRYKEICACHGCKARVFTQPRGDLAAAIGCPGLIVLFTGTVSHIMVRKAKDIAAIRKIALIHSHCGSCNALRNILRNWTAGKEACMK